MNQLLLHSEKIEEVYNRSTLPALARDMLNNKQKIFLLIEVMVKQMKNKATIKMMVKTLNMQNFMGHTS